MDEGDETLKERGMEYGDAKLFFPAHAEICELFSKYRVKADSPFVDPACNKLIEYMLLKLQRLSYNPAHKDSLNDLIGYARLFQDRVKSIPLTEQKWGKENEQTK